MIHLVTNCKRIIVTYNNSNGNVNTETTKMNVRVVAMTCLPHSQFTNDRINVVA